MTSLTSGSSEKMCIRDRHRIELVRELDGVRWYNDSIASSPSRTIAGLRSFPEKVLLIAGGKDKGISYDAIGPEINEHVKALILCGATAGVIRAAVEKAANFTGLPITEVDSYQSAVALAREDVYKRQVQDITIETLSLGEGVYIAKSITFQENVKVYTLSMGLNLRISINAANLIQYHTAFLVIVTAITNMLTLAGFGVNAVVRVILRSEHQTSSFKTLEASASCTGGHSGIISPCSLSN